MSNVEGAGAGGNAASNYEFAAKERVRAAQEGGGWFSDAVDGVKDHINEHGRVGWIASFRMKKGMGATIDLGSAKLSDETGGYWTTSGYVKTYSEGRTLTSLSVPFLGEVSAENVTRNNGQTWDYGSLEYNKSVFIELLQGEPVTFDISIGVGYVYENTIVIGGD